jgi:hypothetical protein
MDHWMTTLSVEGTAAKRDLDPARVVLHRGRYAEMSQLRDSRSANIASIAIGKGYMA